MKKITLIILIMLSVTGLQAQNIFFPTKVGSVQTYATLNNKGKVEGYVRQTITDIKGGGNDMTISYLSEIIDKENKDGESKMSIPLTIHIKDGIMYFDLNSMMPAQKDQPQMGELKMEITGAPTEIPTNLQVGQTLKDANMVMSMNMGFIKMKTEVNLTNGKCLAIEDVTVPAGTYKSHKVTQTAQATVMKIKSTTTTITWYAPGVGTVKSETYDKDNKLQSSMELVASK